MKYLAAILMLFLLSCADEPERPFYVGTWQSNEAKTMESMAKVDNIPENARKALQDGFYGRLVNVIQEDSFTTYFIDQKPENPRFIDAKIEVIAPDTVRMQYLFEARNEMVTREITIKDNCYTIPVAEWGFDEYFCRVD